MPVSARPYCGRLSHISCPLLHHLVRTSYQQRGHIRYLGLGIARGRRQALRHVWPAPPCDIKQSVTWAIQGCIKARETHATASADGPSLAGPISERVVKPEALGNSSCKQLIAKNTVILTHDRDRQHRMLAPASTRMPACWFCSLPWLVMANGNLDAWYTVELAVGVSDQHRADIIWSQVVGLAKQS